MALPRKPRSGAALDYTLDRVVARDFLTCALPDPGLQELTDGLNWQALAALSRGSPEAHSVAAERPAKHALHA